MLQMYMQIMGVAKVYICNKTFNDNRIYIII